MGSRSRAADLLGRALRSHEIRERFLRYFEDHGHHRLPSASLITHDDPSLLFTVAGMVPLKKYITGEVPPPSPRLVSCQKCFRGQGLRDDITEVGDSTHQTFFEMLGNWSIGDYFKEGAIASAWQLLTEEFKLDPDRMWPSIYPDDSESERIWRDLIGIPGERIVRLTDNWWQAGPTGPCGYDSEIYWDWGGRCSCGRSDCRPGDECGGDRWVEFWNLVFMEFDRDDAGTLTPLPKKTVDTGLGLDRVVGIVQGVRSNYETDLFRDIVGNFAARSSAPPGAQRVTSLHVLADHVRAATFLIADGVLPGNEARGYVLRRLVRRALVHGRRVDLRGGLAPGVASVVEVMGDTYPEIVANRELVETTLRIEEEAFARTIDAASDRLAGLLDSGAGTISGEEAFRLHDTYGMPIDLTSEMAAERGVTVDRAGFDDAMAEQRARSRAAHVQVGFEGGPQLPSTTFVGYQDLEADATVLRIGGIDERETLAAGEEDAVILDISPFYAEAGGQVGDVGELHFEGGHARVLDTVYGGAARLHAVRVECGELRNGLAVHAAVDGARRAQVARHHSATHFLNQALRETLGGAVVQRGSFVGPDHTTFDFSFHRALTAAELRELEERVNDRIRADLRRTVAEMPLSEARASGAIALLDENYTESVRVVDFGGWSRELCGGTHVGRTGEVGAAIILNESSIGQGVRRIEMVVGRAAERHWQDTNDALVGTARALRARPLEVPQRVASLQEQLRRTSRALEEARRAGDGVGLAATPTQLEDFNGIPYAVLLVDSDADGDAIIHVLDRLFADQLGAEGVAVVMGRDTFAIKVGKAAQARGIRAGDMVKAAAALMGGGGGGPAQFARGGIKDIVQREAALALIRDTVQRAAGGEAA